MKKMLCLLLVFCLVAFTGCGEAEEGPRVYAKPTFTPGTLESDLLKAEPGNFDRANYTNTGANFTSTLLEIDSGYYYERNSLFYSEGDDLDRKSVV